MDVHISKQHRTILLLLWAGTIIKLCFFISNCDKREPSVNIHRYRRDEKKEIQVKQPACIHKYNKGMSGVDRADQNVSTYRIGIRSKKWCWPLFAWVPDVIRQNAWLLYRCFKTANDPKHDLLSFRREIVMVYLTKYKTTSQSRSVPRIQNVPDAIRYDQIGHFF